LRYSGDPGLRRAPQQIALQHKQHLTANGGDLTSNEAWWRQTIVYEIATISFQDSDGDGKGDLQGILSRLDYLRWLGIGTVWLTPIYPSPMLDFGYDISDFCGVEPQLGNLALFDRLITELHRRDIRLILDFVPNHTSDQHPWFVESRTSCESSKRDWYIWSDPASHGGPPNNWQSRFGGSGWEWDVSSGQYYYHSFLRQQPDLNWHNPNVRAAMGDAMRFWMKRGVDGFRVDASAVLSKDSLLRDNPPDPEAGDSKPPPQRFKNIFNDDRPEAMSYLAEVRNVLDEFEDRMLCGEVQGKIDRIGHFYGERKPRLHLPLNFALLDTPWDAISLQGTIDAYYNAIPDDAWPDWVIGGHDKHRAASKLGQAQARILAMLLLTLKGTPFLFAGDELGREQVDIPQERVNDPFERLLPGYALNRDPERAPMPWERGLNAGFTDGEPWLPMGPDVQERNVAVLQEDERSVLWLYKRLIEVRRTERALTMGRYVPMRSRNDVLIYRREWEEESIVIALNITNQPRCFELAGEGRILLSSHLDLHGENVEGPLMLRADEGLVIKL
jgi:alpha-glucosidase